MLFSAGGGRGVSGAGFDGPVQAEGFERFLECVERVHREGSQGCDPEDSKGIVSGGGGSLLGFGESFGENGKGFMRLSYAASEADLGEALKRMKDFIEA